MLKVAVVINSSARSVGSDEIGLARSVIPEEDIYISNSIKESKKISALIVRKGYDVVLSMGGDGTLSWLMTDIRALYPRKRPAYGVLRGGTGNGVAGALGVGPYTREGILAEYGHAQDPGSLIEKAVLQVGDRIAPWFGIGLDAWVLRDYNVVKGKLDKLVHVLEKGAGIDSRLLREGNFAQRTMERLLFRLKKNRGVFDYAIAAAGLSFWRYAFNPLPEVTVRNISGDAYRLDRHGRYKGGPIPAGDNLCKGNFSFVSASTFPYYGFELQLFPFTESLSDKGYFQLRVSLMDVWESLGVLWGLLLKGKIVHDKVWDFACKEIEFEVKNPKGLPLQGGGDSMGRHKKVRIKMTKERFVQGARSAAPEPPK